MGKKLWMVLAMMAAGTALSGCAPLVIAGAGAVVADEVMEEKGGGDGLF
ncbi:hypothetical protein [Ostreiculturibacter nitratireducens]